MAAGRMYVGRRLSYAGALCTVRYHGPLSGTKGEWLGVEWDDPSRGKHNGQHEGQQIFQCLSSSMTAASFVRPSRKTDPERTLLEAIKFKYAQTNVPVQADEKGGAVDNAIEISGKVVEEVGFDRIQKQLSVLTDLKIVLVDELVVSGVAIRNASRKDIRSAQLELARTCPNIVELDLGWNVIETWQDVVDMCSSLRKLKILKASALRFREFDVTLADDDGRPFQNVEELQLNECLIRPEHTIQILSPGRSCNFPALKTLSLSLNELDAFHLNEKSPESEFPSVTTVMLENNNFSDLSSLPALLSIFPNTTTLSLQENAISSIGLDSSDPSKHPSFDKLETLKLAGNKITDYSFIDALPILFPNLTSLRISRNPLYGPTQNSPVPNTKPIPQSQQQAPKSTLDSTSYYLTLARIPNLKSLNYTAITPRDREEGEIYYLSVAEKELKAILESRGPNRLPNSEALQSLTVEAKIAEARKAHPLYSPLCAKYDRVDIIHYFPERSQQSSQGTSKPKSELDAYAPGTLGSRLVHAYFYIPTSSSDPNVAAAPLREFSRPLPTTTSVYRLKSLLARELSLPALQFKCVYESEEYDPVEPISGSTRAGDGRGGPAQWERWGDWDVDSLDDPVSLMPSGDVDEGHAASPGHNTGVAPEPGSRPKPMFITVDGKRFKKREIEILDGMRAWGDFLDLDGSDGSRWRDVRVRVEPFVAHNVDCEK